MRINFAVVPIAALALALSSFSAEAAQRGERRSRRGETRTQENSRAKSSARARGNQDRESRAQARTRQRAKAAAQSRNQRANRSPDRSRRSANAADARRSSRVDRGGGAVNRAVPRSSVDRSRSRSQRSDQRTSRNRGRNPRVDSRRTNNRGVPQIRRNYSRYYAPRLLPRRSAPRRHYGQGGRLSLYFGWGSGYRYGSLYRGRIYGYRGRVVSGYGNYRYYGDLRLKVTPREAAVYVDGYYAGIVDDFDGFFQRLTVEVGPHVIEIDAPGLEAQAFDVYVDGARTIDLHADLFR